MPHYRDGTEAKVGDIVKGKNWDGKTIVGRVETLSPGSTTCNMQVAHTVPALRVDYTTATVGEYDLLHRDEVEQAEAPAS